MISSSHLATVRWGDRSALLPKSMTYAFSLQVRAKAVGQQLTISAKAGRLFHLLGDSLISVPEGARYDVPFGDLVAGRGEIGSPQDPLSPRLRMQMSASTSEVKLEGDPGQQKDLILMDSNGVIDMGPSVGFQEGEPRPAQGTVFLATKFETYMPKYRWLNRRQLFGVGRANRITTRTGSVLDSSLVIDLDLYAAA